MTCADQLGKLPPRLQRMLALLLAPAALACLWGGVFWPIWLSQRAQLEWRAATVQALARQRGLASIEAQMREQLEALPNLPSWQQLYRATADNSAVIALQSDVDSALSSAHVRPQAFAPTEMVAAGPLRKIGLRVVASMTVDQLREVLQHLTELTRLVQIEQLQVNAPLLQAAPTNPTLVVTMDVAGYALDASFDATLRLGAASDGA